MLKILEKISNKRPIPIITRSPNQYPNYKTSADKKPKDQYKGYLVMFDDMLGARKSSQIDQILHQGDMKLWMSISLVTTILVYRDKALK